MIELFGHPFSSYCQKVVVALYENATPFAWRQLGADQPGNEARWAALWPLRKMPVLVDGARTVVENSAIIEHLHAHHPGPVRLIPDHAVDAVAARMLDRVFDDYVMTPVQKLVGDALRPADARDPFGVAEARRALDTIYPWLDERLAGCGWAVASGFSLADCAAAPALFYADWAHPIDRRHLALRAYRARLLARPSMARAIDEARPFRAFFPLGAPDRD